MALRQIRLTRALQELRASLKAKLDEQTQIRERRAAWKTREEAAEKALEEIVEETVQEEKDALDAEIADLEKEDDELKEAEAQLEADVADLEKKIADMEDELEKLSDTNEEPAPAPAPAAEPAGETERTRGNTMHRILRTRETREILRGTAGKAFADQIRSLSTRGVTGGALTVPTVMLPLLSQIVSDYSALYGYLNVQELKGDGKQNLLGAVPEAVWTANIGKLNEVALNFNQILVDSHKVAGYVPIPNPYLQDSDEDLAAIALDYLGKGIALAVDKAVIYGTGTNMPIGIMTRLAATVTSPATEPAWWQPNQGTFNDLHASHIGKLSAASVKGEALYKEMLTILGKARNKCRGGNGGKFWCMNETTWNKLKIEALNFNAAGAMVAGMENKMPIIGGDVVELDFIPDDAVIGGYGSSYLLGERAGVQLAASEHAQFIEDNTVFRGIARYDGRPAAGEAFAAFALSTTAIATTTTFAADTANA